MSRQVVPISNMVRRIPEAGRIRTGVKGDRGPKAIPEFRFTSHDSEALGQIAAMYGGEVKPWSDPKAAEGQFEVITSAPEIRVVLPPDPLGGTPVYEMWSGGGCQRRCDGLNAAVLQQGPDGLEPVDVPCLCSAKGEMACKVVTRLSVILPEVRFAGVWRLDSKSWNAAQELPGMVDMIQQMQGRGLTYATLALKRRRSVQGGQTQRFIVPVLGIPASVEQLAAGGAQLGSLPSAPSGLAALPSGAPGPDPAGEAEIVEAEIVDDASTPLSLEDLKAAVKAAGWSQAQAIRRVGELAAATGVDAPTNLTAVADDPTLCAALLGELKAGV